MNKKTASGSFDPTSLQLPFALPVVQSKSLKKKCCKKYKKGKRCKKCPDR